MSTWGSRAQAEMSDMAFELSRTGDMFIDSNRFVFYAKISLSPMLHEYEVPYTYRESCLTVIKQKIVDVTFHNQGLDVRNVQILWRNKLVQSSSRLIEIYPQICRNDP